MTSAVSSPPTRPTRRTAAELAVAALAAVLASGCCVAPLALALAGVSGAWIGQMRRIEPWSPWLMGVSFVALALAGWRLYRPATSADAACAIDDAACRRANGAARGWFWVVTVLALVPLVAPLVAPWFY